MKNLMASIQTTLILITLGFALGCTGPKGNEGPAGKAGQNGQQGPAGMNTNDQPGGKSSGGGGYMTKDSKKFLELMSQSLARIIRRADDNIFKDLPQDWDKEKLARIIERVRLYDKKFKIREEGVEGAGEELMFDYGEDDKGPYIAALRQFFIIYGKEPVDYKKYLVSDEGVLNIFDKLLHEVAHHLPKIKGDDKAADRFAKAVLRALFTDTIFCDVPDGQVFENLPHAYNFKHSERTNVTVFYQVFNRDGLFVRTPEAMDLPQVIENTRRFWEKNGFDMTEEGTPLYQVYMGFAEEAGLFPGVDSHTLYLNSFETRNVQEKILADGALTFKSSHLWGVFSDGLFFDGSQIALESKTSSENGHLEGQLLFRLLPSNEEVSAKMICQRTSLSYQQFLSK